ncbi:MAG: helix-turn-helix domain-containing protein [Candidatus Burarchaeum sp.]|nr:helix-turn-helix domain-containing protein [Candidatus Burarchaeum sp.]MDO8339150.1 helix-turn-helix domain-containing protein [Candidatus Burarchaeum sp.]
MSTLKKHKHPLVIELEQRHNCYTVDCTDKTHDTRIKWLTTLAMEADTVSHLFEIHSANLAHVLKKLARDPRVKTIQLIRISGNLAQVIIKQKRDVSTYRHLSKTGTIWLSEYSEEGVDKVAMLAPSEENWHAFLDAVKDEYDIRLKAKRHLEPKDRISYDLFGSSGFLKLKTASELLTERQMNVFELACKLGYYEEPKKVSIEELSAKLGVSSSTAAELLRKAEGKLLPILSDILRMMR